MAAVASPFERFERLIAARPLPPQRPADELMRDLLEEKPPAEPSEPPLMMGPDLLAIFGMVMEDMGEWLEQLEELGPRYARAYVEHIAGRGRKRQNAPKTPAGLNLDLAKLIREAVLEQAAVARMDRGIEERPRRAAARRVRVAAEVEG